MFSCDGVVMAVVIGCLWTDPVGVAALLDVGGEAGRAPSGG